ncbi:lrr receptor-like serine threonine-protein kinase [Hordeum vulgare]|nr:lrr receptor-like serine threonine-protein kinase [Hordeum vulgare]
MGRHKKERADEASWGFNAGAGLLDAAGSTRHRGMWSTGPSLGSGAMAEDDGWGKKRKLAFTGFDPYDLEYSDDEEYEYDSGEDVYKGNLKSFKAKEVEKIKAKGVASFFNRKIKKWRCPYCTTKPKPKDGCFDHLVSHAEDVANRGEDYIIRGVACYPREGTDFGVM